MGTVENPYAGQGSVLLDIGDDVGALVVVMPAAMDGIEIEIKPAGDYDHHHHDSHHEHRADEHEHEHGHAHRPHVAVVARPVGGGLVHSLVFPELVEGTYELYRKLGGPVELTVSIAGGQVTETRWPA